jgi:transposase
MSIKAKTNMGIPEETRQVAKAAFPKGNVYLWMRDELGELYRDDLFAGLYPEVGQPALSPGKLGLVTIMQFMEGMSDRQAADAVRARIDWKYALGMKLDDPGFDFSVLSEFRQRLAGNPEKQVLLDEFLKELLKRGWLRARGKQRTDSTHVLAAIRSLNRLELVGETMRRALNELAEADPAWLQGIAKLEWYPRYAQRMGSGRLPKKPEEREQLSLEIGMDGFFLMNALLEADGKEELWKLPGVEILRQVWVQQYWIECIGDHDDDFHLHLRTHDNQPPGDLLISSPYDAEARYSTKRSTEWVGYKVVLTETCDDDLPHIITNVETSVATEPDVSITERVHQSLESKQLLPADHLVDAGFIDGELLVQAQDHFGITLCGPVQKDVRWQATQEDGFGLSNFHIDWDQRTATCPQGKIARAWTESKKAAYPLFHHIQFKSSDCHPCPVRHRCTKSKRGSRTLDVLPRPHHEALQKARQEQKTAEFWKKYAKRSGIEGTLSQGVRAYDLRCSRYIGLVKTGLQMMLTTLAMNMYRLFNWLAEYPLSTTRISHFARLAPVSVSVSRSWRTR